MATIMYPSLAFLLIQWMTVALRRLVFWKGALDLPSPTLTESILTRICISDSSRVGEMSGGS